MIENGAQEGEVRRVRRRAGAQVHASPAERQRVRDLVVGPGEDPVASLLAAAGERGDGRSLGGGVGRAEEVDHPRIDLGTARERRGGGEPDACRWVAEPGHEGVGGFRRRCVLQRRHRGGPDLG